VDSWRTNLSRALITLALIALRGVRPKITQLLRQYTVSARVSRSKPIREYLTYEKTLLAASQTSVKSRNAVRFARICRLIERDMAFRESDRQARLEQLREPLAIQIGVANGRTDRPVPKVSLDDPDVGSLVDQSVSAGVTEHMRVDIESL
jgi:hypothetical protein